MRRRYLPSLLLLAAIWGASYLFIKVGVREIEPIPMIELRLLLALAVLLPFLAWRMGVRRAAAELVAAWRPGLVLGVINGAIPFTLIAWGEKHVDSGIAAIANASVPIFLVTLAVRFRPSERVSGARLGGVLVGLAGVGLLTGANPDGGWWAVAGTLAVVVASVSYAAAGLYGQGRSTERSGPILAAASILGGALVLLPFSFLQLPDALPSWKALGSVAALGVLGTGFAQLILFRMWRLHGSARTSLVTYLLPPAALFYGATILGEPLRLSALAGLALILLGVALGSGLLRLRRALAAPAP